MKKGIVRMAMWVVVPTLVIGLSSCTTKKLPDIEKLGGIEETAVLAMENGIIFVDTLTITATVTGKNVKKGKLTLSSDTGKTTFKATPEMKQYDQIKVGDRVVAVITAEMAVYFGADTPPNWPVTGGVVHAPEGAKPGGTVIETSQVPVVVTAVDTAKNNVTFKRPDGTSKTINVRDKVDLSKIVIGKTLTMFEGQGMAISVTTQ
jgi:hypothetical protein